MWLDIKQKKKSYVLLVNILNLTHGKIRNFSKWNYLILDLKEKKICKNIDTK